VGLRFAGPTRRPSQLVHGWQRFIQRGAPNVVEPQFQLDELIAKALPALGRNLDTSDRSDRHNSAGLPRRTVKLPGLIHGDGARGPSVSLWFRVASKRSGNYGNRCVAGDTDSLDALAAAPRKSILLRRSQRAQCHLRETASLLAQIRATIGLVCEHSTSLTTPLLRSPFVAAISK
jgi:hypothetical protein